MKAKKYVTVYCSSSNNIDDSYFQLAKDLGKSFADEGIGLVYGGGTQGLMGAIATSVTQAGGEVIGVIPEYLVQVEKPYKEATQLHYVKDLQERKKMLWELPDIFLVLPGGLGTLDEMFEVLTLKMLGLLSKPFIIFNVQDFYKKLVEFLQELHKVGFIKNSALHDIFSVCSSNKQVMDCIKDSLSME